MTVMIADSTAVPVDSDGRIATVNRLPASFSRQHLLFSKYNCEVPSPVSIWLINIVQMYGIARILSIIDYTVTQDIDEVFT